MAIPSSGTISFTTIQTEFGGSNPIGLSEYYAGGGRVPAGTSGTNGPVPSSGAISVRNFYGTSAVTVPGAPTIGTATATGSTTATVSFTQPASNGGSVITSYTATSSPGGITGTLNQAGSGTITVTGLTAATSYTFTVKATNAIGQGAASAASNTITTVPVVGQAYGGGYFAGQISTSANGVATHNLVVCDITVGQTNAVSWGPTLVTTGATSEINGPANSATLAALGALYQAATFCEGVSSGGYTDWYLPATRELITVYYFLKPSTDTNFSNYYFPQFSGSNAYAVSPQPISTPWTAYGPPVQTTATNFRDGASQQEFTSAGSALYWASTEDTADNAFKVRFSNGDSSSQTKTNAFSNRYARAIRRVAV